MQIAVVVQTGEVASALYGKVITSLYAGVDSAAHSYVILGNNIYPEINITIYQIAPGLNIDNGLGQEEAVVVQPRRVPTYGTVEWMHYWSNVEGYWPSPIDICITGSLIYKLPPIRWYNFDVYPHKIRLTNTGYTVLLGGKWKRERPYVVGGPLLEKHVLGQIHFHWGSNMMEGSEHRVDNNYHPGEMQVTFFRSEYLTQEEALQHEDGVIMFCYIIRHGVYPDPRLAWILEKFPEIQECEKFCSAGPLPMSKLIPTFYEDYFLYWGLLPTVRGDKYAIRWLVPRVCLYASYEQMEEFRKLWDPWDEPNSGNFRPIAETNNRHVFFINPHWNLYNSLLPLPRVIEETIAEPMEEYHAAKPWIYSQRSLNMSKVGVKKSQMEGKSKKKIKGEAPSTTAGSK